MCATVRYSALSMDGRCLRMVGNIYRNSPRPTFCIQQSRSSLPRSLVQRGITVDLGTMISILSCSFSCFNVMNGFYLNMWGRGRAKAAWLLDLLSLDLKLNMLHRSVHVIHGQISGHPQLLTTRKRSNDDDSYSQAHLRVFFGHDIGPAVLICVASVCRAVSFFASRF